jgi:hypothetical protein
MPSTLELAPVDYTLSPEGVVHLISQNPEDYQTLCGIITRNPGKGVTRRLWTMIDETLSGEEATCLPCRAEWRARKVNVRLQNLYAEEGVDRCQCGSKYWEHDHCVSCGAEWTPELRETED